MDLKNKNRALLPLALGILLAASIVWFYWPVLHDQFTRLLSDEDYSFGLLLPLVSGYIVYRKWPQIKAHPWRPSWTGLVVLALGFCLYVSGELITDLYTPSLSFLVVLAGLIVLLGGWGLFRLLAFPLLLLFLMIPLPDFVMRQLTLPLQLVSSRLAAGLLRGIGIPVVLQGNIIDMGSRQLQVVAACSGLRYILSLTAFTVIYCYFYQRCLWKAALLLFAIIPAAIIANALRVAGMGVFPALQQGFWHLFSGWLIFVFCFAFIALFSRALNLLRPAAPAQPGQMAAAAPTISAARPALTPYLAVALALVVLAAPLRLLAQAPPTPLCQSFTNFPMKLDHWCGHHVYIDPAMVEATKADAFLNADYSNPTEGSLSLWITYYESQKKAGASVHSPFSCFRGSGWLVLDSQTFELAPGLPVKYMLIDQSGARLVVYYWFLQRGRWIANEYLNKFYVGFDSLFRRRADGALIRLVTPATPDIKSSRERLNAFSRLLIPVLPHFIKN
jgi:exosortase D (VPLPA-CTERM-specific)